jgi:hypothetical protein
MKTDRKQGPRQFLINNSTGADIPMQTLFAALQQFSNMGGEDAETLDHQLFVAAKEGNMEKLEILMSLSCIGM